jgi:gluconokinase
MGTAGAGKSRIGSALATALGARFIEGDAYHPPENVARMAAGIPLTDADRHGWLLALAAELRTARERGQSVVLACSALRRAYRELLRSGDEAIRFVVLQADETLLRARLEKRQGHYMPASLLASQLATLELPGADERAWVLHASDTPEMILSQIHRHLHDAGQA